MSIVSPMLIMSIIYFFLCSDKSLGVTPSVNINLFFLPVGSRGFVSGVESVDLSIGCTLAEDGGGLRLELGAWILVWN